MTFDWIDCKILTTIFYFSSQYSSSLVMVMTIEKCFALYLPLKSKIVCTARKAKRICAATEILLFAFNLQLVFLNKFVTDSIGEIMCVFVGVHEDYEKTFDLIDTVLYSYIPIIATANCLIIIKFMMAKWKNRHGGTGSVNKALSKSAIKGTVILIFVSFAFLILTGPIAIMHSYIIDDPPVIVYGVTVLLQYLNHSTNGVLYCISGSRFRQELKNLFSYYRTKRTVTSSIIITVTTE